MDLGANCAQCPFAVNKLPNKPVLGEGSPNAIGLLIGEGPGREEADVGRPFVGATGRQLDISLVESGLLRSQLFIVNATCCPPPQGKTEQQMKQAVLSCRPAFMRQLEQFPEELPTLAMGKWAYFALTLKDKGVMNARGFVRHDWRIPKGEDHGADQGRAGRDAEGVQADGAPAKAAARRTRGVRKGKAGTAPDKGADGGAEEEAGASCP